MPLKATVTKAELDALPEALRKEYVESNGAFTLTVEGMVAKTELEAANGKITEFRDTNRGLMAKITGLKETFGVADVDELKTKFKDIDPAKVTEMSTELAKLREKGVGKADDLEAKITAAVQAAVTPLRSELQSEREARTAAETRVRTGTLRTKLTDLALKAGAKANAVDVIVERALPVFELAEGDAVVAKDGHYSAEKPAEKITPAEWLTVQAKGPLDFAFEPSTGSGARNVPGGPAGGNVRTMNVPAGQPLNLSAADRDAVAKGELVIQRG